MKAVIVHGGAINPETGAFANGVKEASVSAYGVLDQGGSPLDAVVQAVRLMEDNPIFNSGTGGWPNLDGEIELDAIIVDGNGPRSGAVAAIKRVKNPVMVARKVMEETDHILLVGEGAIKFARAMGFQEYDPSTPERLRKWRETKASLMAGEDIPLLKYWSKIRKFATTSPSTVGAVAVDGQGKIAAATSSGGFPMKLPGRVGDVPILGCSTYASSALAGVSLTGHGEVVVSLGLARKVVDFADEGLSMRRALEAGIELVNRNFGLSALIGGIALDDEGNFAASRNCELMPHAVMREDLKEPLTAFATIIR